VTAISTECTSSQDPRGRPSSGDVRGDGERPPALLADAFHERVEAVGAAGRDHDVGAELGQRRRRLLADAAARAGDQRDSAGKGTVTRPSHRGTAALSNRGRQICCRPIVME
jgi:hypothetical protein